MRTVRVLVYAQAALLEIAIALRVFDLATERAVRGKPSSLYDVQLISLSGGRTPTDAGVSVPTSRAHVGELDTLLIPSGSEAAVEDALSTTRIGKFLREQMRSTERIGAIGGGALLLARAGLIEGRRVAAAASASLREFTTIHNIRDRPYVVDGQLWTSAAAFGACQLALAMVEHDIGQNAAESVAEALNLVAAEQPGPMAPPSTPEQGEPELELLQALKRWIDENPADDLSTAALAAKSGFSVRSLHRRFMTLTGDTPAKFVEAARVRAARRLLETTSMTLQAIAENCGFSSAAVMHSAFKRQTGMSAARYRRASD